MELNQWPPKDALANLVKGVCNVTSINYNFESQEIIPGVDIRHAAHCVIFARTKREFATSRGVFPLKAYVMMQMRFDGTLGFPGGFIDPGESVLDCLNREMKEEICLDLAKFAVKKDDFVAMQVLDKKDEKFGQVYNKIHLYFFIKEVDEESFLKIEEDSRKAEHFGTESLGQIRAPLHIYREVDGFPRFLTNTFAGTSKDQFLLAIYKAGLLTEEEIISGYGVFH